MRRVRSRARMRRFAARALARPLRVPVRRERASRSSPCGRRRDPRRLRQDARRARVRARAREPRRERRARRPCVSRVAAARRASSRRTTRSTTSATRRSHARASSQRVGAGRRARARRRRSDAAGRGRPRRVARSTRRRGRPRRAAAARAGALVALASSPSTPHAPWGAGAAPPAGDLRAPREALLAHADHVVHVDATPRAVRLASTASRDRARVVRLVVRGTSRRSLHGHRASRSPRARARAAGLDLAGGRPRGRPRSDDRALARIVAEADATVDVWLATAKCAVHLERVATRRTARNPRWIARSSGSDGARAPPPRASLAMQLATPDDARVRLAPTCMP